MRSRQVPGEGPVSNLHVLLTGGGKRPKVTLGSELAGVQRAPWGAGLRLSSLWRRKWGPRAGPRRPVAQRGGPGSGGAVGRPPVSAGARARHRRRGVRRGTAGQAAVSARDTQEPRGHSRRRSRGDRSRAHPRTRGPQRRRPTGRGARGGGAGVPRGRGSGVRCGGGHPSWGRMLATAAQTGDALPAAEPCA